MNYFNWDFTMITPTIMVNTLLANGIIYDNEDLPTEEIEEMVSKVQ